MQVEERGERETFVKVQSCCESRRKRWNLQRCFKSLLVGVSVLTTLMLMVCTNGSLKGSFGQWLHLTSESNEPSYYSPSLLARLREVSKQFQHNPQCRGWHNVTIVSAYFDIGAFPKGSSNNLRHSNDYMQWLRGFSMLANPVIFYTDDQKILQLFLHMRDAARGPCLCTEAYLLNRTELWPWQHVQDFTVALKSLPYVYSPPCTTNAEYDAAVNSKYPLMELSVQLNRFGTPAFAWLDAGEYRHMANEDPNRLFLIELPPNLADDQVAYLEIFERSVLTAEEYFLGHVDWLAGGSFYGFAEPMLTLAREYSRMAQLFMRRNLVGADQQVLAAMFAGIDNNLTGIGYPKVKLKLYDYQQPVFHDPWFQLAYLTRKNFSCF